MGQQIGAELLGDYNVTMILTDYSDRVQSLIDKYNMKSIEYISFMVAEGADVSSGDDNLWKEVKRYTNPTPESMDNISFTFDVSKYVTPASGKFVSFKARYRYKSDDGESRGINVLYAQPEFYDVGLIPENGKNNDGSKNTVFLYIEAPTTPSNLVVSNEKGVLSEGFSINFVGSEKGTFDLRYWLWIFVYDMDNNSIIDMKLIDDLALTNFIYNIRNLVQGNNKIKNLIQMQVEFFLRATDIYSWAYSDAILSSRMTIINNTYNIFKKESSSEWVSIGINNSKQINEKNLSDMKIKFLNDGSEWGRIFWHDISNTETYFTNEEEVKSCSLSNRYSRLNEINNFLFNGKYEFMICYPKYDVNKYNRWVQTANPLITTESTAQTIESMGYIPVHIDFPINWGCGLALSTREETFMDCETESEEKWFGAVGQYMGYVSSNNITGLAAPTEDGMEEAQKEVELWIRIHRNVKIIPKEKSI